MFHPDLDPRGAALRAGAKIEQFAELHEARPFAGPPDVTEPEMAPPPRLEVVTAKSLANGDPPPRSWLVEELIPKKNVTLLNGDGGTGKSLLALQLAVATAIGSYWVGREVAAGSCLYVSAEDDIDELHRRLAQIGAALQTELAHMDGLTILPLAGRDAVLAAPSGTLKPTPLFRSLEAYLREHKPALIVLDTLADMFGGEENHRAQARQFIGMLRGLCVRHHSTILVLAHPSVAGMASGTGSSGSTAWNNSVRSRALP